MPRPETGVPNRGPSVLKFMVSADNRVDESILTSPQ
jgi:hypothetical protein